MQTTKITRKGCVSKAAIWTVGLVFTAPAWATTQGVPEPNTFFLIGAGIVSAILFARYKAKK